MLAYANLGTNDIDAAKAFYVAALEPIGGRLLMEGETPTGGRPMLVFGQAMDRPLLIVSRPYDGEAASVGNGAMVALQCPTPDAVAAVHAAALAAGGTDEGAPGPRGGGIFVCGYFRDLDGNKLNAFCMTEEMANGHD